MKFSKYIIFFNVLFFIMIFKVNALDDGVYKIESELGKVLEYDGSLGLGSNVRINEFNNSKNQKWILKKIDDSYIITSLSDSYYSLDVTGAGINIGVNVQMWEYNGTLAQKWNIVEDGNYFNIICLCNNLYLDVAGASRNNGTNIHMWEGNGTNAQRFKFEKIDMESHIEDGSYYIESSSKSNHILKPDGESITDSVNDYKFSSSFEVENKNGRFLIKNNDKFLGVLDDKVVLTDSEFFFEIEDNYDGTYGFVYDGRYLDFDNISLTNWNGFKSQKFKLNKVDTNILDDGVYTISNRGVYLSFNGTVPTSGRNVLLSRNDNNSKWKLKRIEDNIYEISCVINDRYVLDVSGANSSNGTNIQVWESNGTNAQRFRIIKNGDDYNIIGLASKCIDVAAGDIRDGTNIWLWESNGTDAQRFKIEKSDFHFDKVIDDGMYIMETSLNLNKSIKFYSNPYIYDLFGNSSDVVNIQYDGNGFYTLKSNGLYLTDDGSISMRSYAGSERQAWYIVKNGNYYSLCSKYSGNFIDVPGANSSNGMRLQTFEGNGTLAQKYNFEEVTDTSVDTGYYNIKIGDKFLGYDSLSNGAKIRSGKEDKWYIKNIGDNIYEIKAATSLNKVMDVTGGNVNDGTTVQMHSYNATDSQRWRIICLKSGGFKFVSERSHSILTLDSYLKIYGNLKRDNQVFNLTQTDEEVYEKTIDDGYYIIKSNGKALDDSIILSDFNSKVSQIWKFKYVDYGIYNIISALNPKKALTYDNGVKISNYGDLEGQMWHVKVLEDGSVDISTLLGVSLDDIFGVNFTLSPYTDIKRYEGIDISKWQGNVDFGKLAMEKPNFIIMRLGYGEKDDRFEEYYSEASRYDIPIGVYTHSKAQSVSDAYIDAEKTMRWLGGKALDLPIFYDIEDDNQISLGRDALTRIVSMFCDTIMSYNYTCGVYANKWWLNEFLNASQLASKYPIWMAHYTGVNNYADAVNHFSDYNASPYMIWQFTDQGRLSGITENTVDLDLGFDIYD